MADSVHVANDEAEALVLQQALQAFREVKRAMQAAPHGHGLEVTEQAAVTQGRRFTATLMQQAISAHPEAQKGAMQPGMPLRQAGVVQGIRSPAADQRRRRAGGGPPDVPVRTLRRRRCAVGRVDGRGQGDVETATP